MKTIVEESRLYAESKANPMFRSLEVSIAEKAFKAGVEFAQRWISVEDELPEVKNHGFSDLVLTKNSYDNIMLERYDSESKKFNGIRYDCIKNNDGQVTHWRPIELK